MAWFGKPKKHERFYLLPGQGGRSHMRKQKLILRWAIVAALLTSAVLACILYLINTRPF